MRRAKPGPALAAKLAALVFGAALLAVSPARAAGKDDTAAIAVEAYLYLYPLVVMEYTRRQLTNVPPGRPGIAAPMNVFAADPAFPTPAMRSVPRPNFDTLYSPAWVDLTAGPVLLETPDTHGRYIIVSILDMWTEVFASLGTRTTGTNAGHFLLTPRGGKDRCPRDCRRARSRCRRPPTTCGSSDGSRPMASRTFRPSTRCRKASP